VPNANGVKAVQAGLRDDNWPIGMPATRLSENAQHRMLSRISYLHCDQQQV
jgi:hypothetical protein